MEKREGFIEKEARNLARRIAMERIAPTAGDRDGKGAFPREAIEVLGDVGLLGMVVAENHGGVGAMRITHRGSSSRSIADRGHDHPVGGGGNTSCLLRW